MYLSFPSAMLLMQLRALEQELAIGIISRRSDGLQIKV